MRHLKTFSTLAVAVLLATVIGFAFEVKAANAFDRLNSVNDDIMVTVMRDGGIHQIARKDIVVGETGISAGQIKIIEIK